MVAEEAVLVVRTEEAHCGVAAAPTGCQGAETHVSSAARLRVTGRCCQSEVSAYGGDCESVAAVYFF